MEAYSIFKPTITVFVSGRIEVDFVDSYEDSYDPETDDYHFSIDRGAVAYMDSIVGGIDDSASAKLRRLADAVDEPANLRLTSALADLDRILQT